MVAVLERIGRGAAMSGMTYEFGATVGMRIVDHLDGTFTLSTTGATTGEHDTDFSVWRATCTTEEQELVRFLAEGRRTGRNGELRKSRTDTVTFTREGLVAAMVWDQQMRP